MLAIYRRHEKDCQHRAAGRKYRRCRCPIWVDGTTCDGREIRQSLKLRSWEEGLKKAQELEIEGKVVQAEPITIAAAWERFLHDAQARELRPPTLYKYRLLSRQMQSFAREHGMRYLREFDVDATRKFRSSWMVHNLAALKKLEYLRAFFRFAFEGGWVSENAAKKIGNPRVTARPTMPFSREEMGLILAGCDRQGTHRLRALVYLLRYSGLRMMDAVTLATSRIADGKLLLYTAKTGTPVHCPLPAFVLTALDASRRPGSRYFFWTGESKPESATGDWRRCLARLFVSAGVENAHPHRFRDTFAVELLLAGVPLERVSILLGHSSIRITERHYSPWVRSRQEQLEADVRRTWELDGLTKGTPEVHGATVRPN